MDLQITFNKNLPVEYHAMAEKALHDAIAFLESKPRPMANPPVEYFTPQWESLKFGIGNHTKPIGMFSEQTMGGWVQLTVRTNNDLVLDSEPPTTFLNQDLATATTCHMVAILDGFFYDGIHFDRQLQRQLQYLDSVAAGNKSVRSLVDDFEQAQAEQAEKERMAIYLKQYSESRRKRLAAQAEARRIKPVAWYDEKFGKQETVANASDKVVMVKPHYCTHERPAPPPPPPQLREHPTPELDEFQKQQVAQTQAMLDYVQQNAITTDTFCTNPEPSTGTEDHDM